MSKVEARMAAWHDSPPPSLSVVRSADWYVVRRADAASLVPSDETIRGLGRHVLPILIIAGSAEERDRIARALAGQVQGVQAAAAPTIDAGELHIDKAAHRVSLAGEEVGLTALEFKLLVTLAERADHVQSRATLLVDVWGFKPHSATRTVDTHVKRLREKIGSAARFIQSVRGVGYRFSEKLAGGRRERATQ